MKQVQFRPLRRVKKTGKIVVAAYSQWRKILTTDQASEYARANFALSIKEEYANMPVDEQVYNHEGKPLFWKDFNPADIPVYTSEEMRIFEIEIKDLHRRIGGAHYGMRWKTDGRISYCVRNLDCDGIPAFSHNTIDYVAESKKDWADYEPLTVGIVVKWFGWFLYQLQNSQLA